MNLIKYAAIILLGSISLVVNAQSNYKDTTVSFKVFGVCVQCEHRIEKALKIKGVQSANWNVNTKMLSVRYLSQTISLDQLHKTVAAAGHDTEKEKASDEVYKALPECCHYREMLHDQEISAFDSSDKEHIRGIVVEEISGQANPLAGATVSLLGTSQIIVTNPHGEFMLHGTADGKLVITYSGLKTDTVSINGLNDIEIRMVRKSDLAGIVISTTARKRTAFIDSYNPFRTSIITKKELLKAACCNLSESFETNPSVDVSYNDAATGSKQIQLLGLAGNYTQLTVENLPGPRGLATPLGLNSVAGPWIESMQLIKGTGSVVNGFESIAGQINIELKKPREAEKLYLNGYINNMGKTDVNLNLAHRVNNKWSTGFLLHDDFLYNKTDFNKDGFRDLPTGNQFSGVHRWQYVGENGLMSQFGVKMLVDNRTGGELAYDPTNDKLTTHHYGLGFDTKRYEAFGKIGYVFPEKTYKSVGFEVSAFDHNQDSYFGLTTYDAKQKNLYSNLIYQSQIKSEANQIKAGVSFLYDNYKEQLNTTNYKRTEVVPGAFAEYSFKYKTKFDLVAGVRADRNNLYGWFATPRLNIRYEPVKGTVLRLNAGRGQRTANIFAENIGVLVSSRQITINNNGDNTRAYGLQPEVAWNKGVSVDQKFKLFHRDAALGVDFYRNDFENQVVVDLENARQAKFYNLDGKSYSNSLQAEVSFTPVNKFDVRVAYRYFDVKTTYGNELLQKALTSPHRAFINLAYDLKGWKLDYTVNYNGRKRIPSTETNPTEYKLNSYSPSYVLMNAQLSKSFGKKKLFDAYVGGENLTNYFQKNAILSADQPFGPYFDASLVWGPVTGRTIYGGFRYTIK
jgi:outer membrane receptor for ferrienterochelin and colicin/copper chaperone CopZ